VVGGASDCLGADEASPMLADREELRVAVATEGRRDGLTWRKPVWLGEGVDGLVAQTGTPVLLNEGDDLRRFPSLVPKGGGIQSALSVPPEGSGRVVGSSTPTDWAAARPSPWRTSRSCVSCPAPPLW